MESGIIAAEAQYCAVSRAKELTIITDYYLIVGYLSSTEFELNI